MNEMGKFCEIYLKGLKKVLIIFIPLAVILIVVGILVEVFL